MKEMTFERRSIRMSLEGWYYSFVLLFIGSAAILRRANLLLVLAAMLVAPLLFNWRFVMETIRHLWLKRTVPRLAIAGRVFRVGLTLSNEAKMDSWSIQIDESIQRESDGQVLNVSVVVDRVPFQGQATRVYECMLAHRGVYRFLPSRISTSYPLGLMRSAATVDNFELLHVAPALGRITDIWQHWAEPEEVDEPRSVGSRGIQDGLFHSIREFRQGDSRRSIHWRSTAKLGKPAVRQFEKQSDREFNLILDLYGEPGSEPNRNCELALSFAATLVNQVSSAGRCELNLLMVGNRHRLHRGHATRNLKETVFHSLADIQPDQQIDLELSIRRMTEAHHPRSPLIIVSSREPVLPRISLSSESDFPLCQLAGIAGQSVPCIWLNTAHTAFFRIFRPPAVLDSTAGSPEGKGQ